MPAPTEQEPSAAQEPDITLSSVVAAAAAAPRARRLHPQLCSYCMAAPPPRLGFLVDELSDSTLMLFCNLRCMGMWAITKGWKK